jgi:4-hydroxy-2-oxoheptanedioate aldolase
VIRQPTGPRAKAILFMGQDTRHKRKGETATGRKGETAIVYLMVGGVAHSLVPTDSASRRGRGKVTRHSSPQIGGCVGSRYFWPKNMPTLSTFGQLRKGLDAGKKFVNAFCSAPSAIMAEFIARQGLDSITIDLQHGLIDYQTALTMLQATAGAGVPAICRVPWNDPIPVMKALDAGFEAIICPMINNREEAEKFASYARYAPRGVRSFGPTRSLNVFGPSYTEAANDQIVTFAMIETEAAVSHLEDILAVPEIDGIYIGPADLTLSMGYTPSIMVTEQKVIEAIEHIRLVTKQKNKFVGIHCSSGAAVSEMLGRGFDLATISTDIRIFVAAVQQELKAARATQQERDTASAY